jgi:hypothetical protein
MESGWPKLILAIIHGSYEVRWGWLVSSVTVPGKRIQEQQNKYLKKNRFSVLKKVLIIDPNESKFN